MQADWWACRQVATSQVGDIVSKDDFTRAEKDKYRELIQAMHNHVEERFGVRDVIQSCVEFCEGSTAVAENKSVYA